MNGFTLIVVASCALIADSIAINISQIAIENHEETGEYVGFLSTLTEKKSMKYLDPKPNIPQLLEHLGLTELYTLVVRTNLDKVLSGEGPFTLFGPTNAALSNLHKPPGNLTEFLEYHVLTVIFPSGGLADELIVKTLNGMYMRVNLYPKRSQTINVATIQCAPVNFNEMDNFASNGLVHVLDGVMMSPANGTLTKTVQQDGNYTILSAALKIAGLDTTLDGEGPFTAFVPNDMAFQKLPNQTLIDLLKNKELLKYVLEYHVLNGTYCGAGLSTGFLKTLNHEFIGITKFEGHVMVNNASVIEADVSVNNGVGHGIDTVLIPPWMEI